MEWSTHIYTHLCTDRVFCFRSISPCHQVSKRELMFKKCGCFLFWGEDDWVGKRRGEQVAPRKGEEVEGISNIQTVAMGIAAVPARDKSGGRCLCSVG